MADKTVEETVVDVEEVKEPKIKFSEKAKAWWNRNGEKVINTAIFVSYCGSFCYLGYSVGKLVTNGEWQKLVDERMLTPTMITEDGSLKILDMADNLQWSKMAEGLLKKK